MDRKTRVLLEGGATPSGEIPGWLGKISGELELARGSLYPSASLHVSVHVSLHANDLPPRFWVVLVMCYQKVFALNSNNHGAIDNHVALAERRRTAERPQTAGSLT